MIQVHHHDVAVDAATTGAAKCHGVTHVHDIKGPHGEIRYALKGTPIKHRHDPVFSSGTLVATASTGVTYHPENSQVAQDHVSTQVAGDPDPECIAKTSTGYQQWVDRQLEKDMAKTRIVGLTFSWRPLWFSWIRSSL